MTFPTPRVVVSKCLGFEACRYNGATIPDPFVEQLKQYVTYLPVCPEVEIGLGVPRDPIRIVLVKGQPRLLQPSTGIDVTERMLAFANQYLGELDEVDGFVLKGRSPSCGIKDVKHYHGTEKGASATQKGAGFFGQAVMEHYPHLPIEEEGRLTHFVIREHFLTRLFALARFRAVKAARSMGALVQFHSENKLLLMAYNESQLRLLGRIVANPRKEPPEAVIQAYEQHLWQALARAPRRNTAINVLMHAMGYFSRSLSAEEKAYFLETLDKYRQGRAPLSVPLSLVGYWIVRFKEPYLAQQTFFAPYPAELVTISDSGKGRDLR